MMFALMDMMAAVHQKIMEVMFERMNNIFGGHRKMAGNENTPPLLFNMGSSRSGRTKRNHKKCSR